MRVSDFKDKHKGEIAFLLGAGPSLHYLDVDLIKDHVTIAVNSGIAKHPTCDYFVSDDWDISNWDYYRDIVELSPCVKFLYKKKFENKCNHVENVVLFDHTWWHSPEDKTYNLDGLKLTKEEPIVGARISMGSAVHLAYIMGCDPIVLLGNDCKFKDGKRYFWQFPGEKKQYRIDNRDFDKTQNRGFSEKSFSEYWKCFAKVNQGKCGVDIIAASGSDLKVFPQRSLKEVLNIIA